MEYPKIVTVIEVGRWVMATACCKNGWRKGQ